MKKFFILTLLVSSFAFGDTTESQVNKDSAQVEQKMSPEKEANIRKLIALSLNSRMINNMMIAMDSEMSKYMDMKDFPYEKMSKRLAEEFTSDETIRAFIRVYNEFFEEDELAELLKFYESPLGSKILTKLPEMSAKIMPISMHIAQKIMVEFLPKDLLNGARCCTTSDCSAQESNTVKTEEAKS